MSGFNAWVLDFGMGYKAAVGGRELFHLIDVPVTFDVPHTPWYCRKVVSWQGRLLPVMDIAARLSHVEQEIKFIAVVGYQNKRGEQPEYAALQLNAPPRQVSVSDEQACGLPENTSGWEQISIACFEHQGEVFPVLGLNTLFNTTPVLADIL